jgi:signal peptidase II
VIAAARALATVGVVVVLDQLTKAWVVSSIHRGERVNVFIGIDLTNVKNEGIAFGAFAGSSAVVIGAVAVALVALIVFFVTHLDTPGLWLPVGMVLGGAVGNLADRARMHGVVDFIDPVLWPAFNLADMSIVIGVLGVLYVTEARR